MYFLIGLGIIVIIVYGNMLYDRIKTKKNKDTTDVEKSACTADNHFAEMCIRDSSGEDDRQHFQGCTVRRRCNSCHPVIVSHNGYGCWLC